MDEELALAAILENIVCLPANTALTVHTATGNGEGFISKHKTIHVKNLYKVLGLQRNATAADIFGAYKRLSRILHPDKAHDKAIAEQMKAAFQEVVGAKEALLDASTRRAYDKDNLELMRKEEDDDLATVVAATSASPSPPPIISHTITDPLWKFGAHVTSKIANRVEDAVAAAAFAVITGAAVKAASYLTPKTTPPTPPPLPPVKAKRPKPPLLPTKAKKTTPPMASLEENERKLVELKQRMKHAAEQREATLKKLRESIGTHATKPLPVPPKKIEVELKAAPSPSRESIIGDRRASEKARLDFEKGFRFAPSYMLREAPDSPMTRTLASQSASPPNQKELDRGIEQLREAIDVLSPAPAPTPRTKFTASEFAKVANKITPKKAEKVKLERELGLVTPSGNKHVFFDIEEPPSAATPNIHITVEPTSATTRNPLAASPSANKSPARLAADELLKKAAARTSLKEEPKFRSTIEREQERLAAEAEERNAKAKRDMILTQAQEQVIATRRALENEDKKKAAAIFREQRARENYHLQKVMAEDIISLDTLRRMKELEKGERLREEPLKATEIIAAPDAKNKEIRIIQTRVTPSLALAPIAFAQPKTKLSPTGQKVAIGAGAAAGAAAAAGLGYLAWKYGPKLFNKVKDAITGKKRKAEEAVKELTHEAAAVKEGAKEALKEELMDVGSSPSPIKEEITISVQPPPSKKPKGKPKKPPTPQADRTLVRVKRPDEPFTPGRWAWPETAKRRLNDEQKKNGTYSPTHRAPPTSTLRWKYS